MPRTVLLRDWLDRHLARDLTHEPHVGSLHEVRVLRSAPGHRQKRPLEVNPHDLPRVREVREQSSTREGRRRRSEDQYAYRQRKTVESAQRPE